MNDRECAAVLGMIEAAFPRGPWPEETESLWLLELRSYELDIAQAAVQRMVTTLTFTPAFAQFVEAVGAERSARRRETNVWHALPRAGRDESWRSHLAAARAVLHPPTLPAGVDPETGEIDVEIDYPVEVGS